ncbi:hypothetical protein C4577_01205 [Candidatus Parcubacteria bacterium]|nr:MAG: hypothetical protein C4577_01205 [Candidatus Parcubacteria bacterium]
MKGDILLSKIVANATETGWSQVYSTLNLYVVISIKREHAKNTIATLGKDVLEKLQREFFALDEKNLESIKASVENTIKSLEENVDCSIILSTIIQNTLYIVIAGQGYVIVKREDKIGIVAEGEEGEINGFSGPLKDNDSIIIETADFYKKVSVDKLSSLLDTLDILDAAENIAPSIHRDSRGTEASIILKYKTGKMEDDGNEIAEKKEEEDVISDNPGRRLNKQSIANKIQNILPSKTIFKRFSFEWLKLPAIGGKKSIILFFIIVLIGALGASIVIEKNRQQQKQQEQEFKAIIDPAQQKYSGALSILNLNKSLAVSELTEVQKMLNDAKNKFENGSNERKKIENLLAEVNNKIDDLDQGIKISTEVLFDSQKDEKVKTIDLVSTKGNSLVVVNKNNGAVLFFSTKGSLQKTLQSAIKDVKIASSDKSYVYLLSGDGIYRLDKEKTKPERIIKNVSGGAVAIDNFLGNIYILNSQENDIEKYVSSGFNKSSYFTNEVDFSSEPVSFSIDSSIWIIQADGKIRKFTKGKEESFSVKGLVTPFGNSLSIYTDKDMSNVYVLDKQSARIVSIGKDGDYVNSYKWDSLKDADSFAIDEANKKGYVVADNKLYSFDLQ